MEKRGEKIKIFLDRIRQIKQELNELTYLSYDISESYNTNKSFPEQETISVHLENLLIAVTHETASQIGFYIEDIQQLTQYIEFREKYNIFTDEELTEILSGNLSLKEKKDLSKRFVSTKNMLEQINRVNQDWNALFENKEYVVIRKKYHL